MGAAWIVAGAMALLAGALFILLLWARRGAPGPVLPYSRDPLTGLYGRQAFYAQARVTLDRNPHRRYVMVYCDLDRFKVYNDLFGTQEGDRLLKGFGQALAGMIQAGTLAGRMEADNFAVLCPEDTFQAERALGMVSDWFTRYREDYTFSFSMGVYRVEDPTLDVVLMCDRAMLASATVKHGYGFKHAYYDQSLRDKLMLEQEIAGQMAGALEQGQFVVYYQPQYSFSTGQVVGAEALVRWLRPGKPPLSPTVFIPIFEKNGFITRLDEYVWTQVCRQMRAWADDPPMAQMCVSVNVSRIDIYNPNLPQLIKQLADKYGVPVERLHLEITESACMDNPAQLIDAVGRLKALGFTIAMDDFGSGYSSLNTLKDVPVDMIKLDLRFLAGGQSIKGGNILCSMVRMAHWLNLPVIAEGVETQRQAEYLLSIGFDYMQGFYFAKPMTAQQLAHHLRHKAVSRVCPQGDQAFAHEANQFLDPDSLTNQVFSRYVGAAAIFEFSPGRLEVLRANEGYLKVMGMGWAEHNRYHSNILDLIVEEDRGALEAMLNRAMDQGEGTCQVHLRPLPERAEGGAWLHIRVKLLAPGKPAPIFYALIEEITQKVSRFLWRMYDLVPWGIARLSADEAFAVGFVNRAGLALLGYDGGRPLSGTGIASLVPREDLADCREAWQKVLAGTQPHDFELRLRGGDERVRWVKGRAQRVKDERGDWAVQVAFSDDTAQHGAAQRALTWQDERLRIISAMTHAMVFDYEPGADRMTFFVRQGESDAQEQVLDGFSAKVLEHDSRRLTARSQRGCSQVIGQVARGERQGTLEFEADIDGTGLSWYRANWVRVPGAQDGAVHVIGRVEDIRSERALRHRAQYDAVTGLYNRATTQELIEQALRDPALRRHCVLAVLDVDNFKEINDNYGHLKGDQLLRAIGQLLKGQFRALDVAGRMGGDEFVLLLKQIPLEVAIGKMDKLALSISQLTGQLGIDHAISLSMGLYQVLEGDATFAQVFERADAALYAAKRQGKDRCQVYEPGMKMAGQVYS